MLARVGHFRVTEDLPRELELLAELDVTARGLGMLMVQGELRGLGGQAPG